MCRISNRLLFGAIALWAATAWSPAVASEQVFTGRGETDLQTIVDAAQPGDVIVLEGGVFDGPVRIEAAITLLGRGGVIDGGGEGSVIVIASPGVRIEALEIRNSGEDVGASDACVYVEPAAIGSVITANTLSECAFGIWIHETSDVEISENHVSSRPELRTNDRGNGIHLFDSSELVVRDNEVHTARDGIYVSATEDSLIQGNHTSNVRYGIHYMYSYRNRVLGNVANDNTVGLALMGSHDMIVEDNVAKRNKRNGLLFRDVEGTQVRRNLLEENGNGMFFFSSIDNVVENNVIVGNEMGLKIWAGTVDNHFEGNEIRGNRQQVFYVSATDQTWGESGRGNYWSDYLGWDQDGDGIGDRPHRVDSFTANLLYRYPSAALLLRSPALETLAHLADMLPMLRTPTVIDAAPIVEEPPS